MKHTAVVSSISASSTAGAFLPGKALFWLFTALFSSVSMAEFNIAQEPLIVDKSVEPNVIYLHDDSSSMTWRFMPDDRSSPGELHRMPDFNKQYYSPDITYELPFKWENGRLVRMRKGLCSVTPSSSSFSALRDGWSNSATCDTFGGLAGTGVGDSREDYAAAVYYDYVPGYNSMRDNPDFDPTKPPEEDKFNYEYWAFRTLMAGAWFLKSGGHRASPTIRGQRTVADNKTMVSYRACPTLFYGSEDSANYYGSLNQPLEIEFYSSNAVLKKFNGLKRGIPHAQCLESYRPWDVDIPGTHQTYSEASGWSFAWPGTGTSNGINSGDPRQMGLPVGRPWCQETRRIPNTMTDVPWQALTSTATPTSETSPAANGGPPTRTSCYVGRHRIGDTNGDGRFDAADLPNLPVSHFKFVKSVSDFNAACGTDGVCTGLNGPEQSREHLITKVVDSNTGETVPVDPARRRTSLEEIENFANWYAYYRVRAKAAQSGVSLAFAQMIDRNDTTKPGNVMNGKYIRLGYDTINRLEEQEARSLGRGTTSNLSGSGVIPFRDFPADAVIPDTDPPRAHPYRGKNFVKDFYDWIFKMTHPGNTPLRPALRNAGRYYETSQPWTEYPPIPGGTGEPGSSGLNLSNKNAQGVPQPFACRKSFTILMTDGYNNVDVSGAGNADCGRQPLNEYRDASGNVVRSTRDANGNDLPEFAFFDQAKYSAGIPQGPFCGENLSQFGGNGGTDSNTLADWAAYYWQKDLQPNIPNRVAGTKKDNAFWQHMQTFTIGLGILGRMSDKQANEFLKDQARVRDKHIFWAFPTNVDTDYERIDDLLHAGLNGRGGTATAQDPGEFVTKLSALLGEIAAEDSIAPGYTIPSGEGEVVSVTAAYNTEGPWTGDVVSRGLKFCSPKMLKAGECDTLGALMKKDGWSASHELRKRIDDPARGFADRKIFTWDGSRGVSFDTNLPPVVKDAIDAPIDRGGNTPDLCPFPRTASDIAANRCRLKGTTEYNVNHLIDYLRGDARFEDNDAAYVTTAYNGFRDRAGSGGLKAYLMDFINSIPYQQGVYGSRARDLGNGAVEFYGFEGHFDYGFAGRLCGRDGPVTASVTCASTSNTSFLPVAQILAYHDRLNEKLRRFVEEDDRGVAYAGSNGGMLHAFRMTDGEELFAFIPQAVHGKLKQVSDPTYNSKHIYTVDGTPRASDIWLDGAWHSVVVGSTGRGGRSFFALDVENPETFSGDNVLWEFTHSDLGTPANGMPVIYPVAGMEPYGHWAVTFGNGYNSDSHRAVLFVVELARTGVPRFFNIDTGVGDDRNPNGLGTPLLFDLDNDGRAETAYAGDALGNLWKFDLVNMQVGNGGQPLLQATAPDGKPQPITAQPGFSQKANEAKINQLVIGTGKFFERTDLTERQIQSIYGVRDFTPDAEAPRTRELATRNGNNLLKRAYARSDAANDFFTNAADVVMPFQSWKLADAPDVTYDANPGVGQLGYVIDLDATGMTGIGASGAEASVSGWRTLVQGTDMRKVGIQRDSYLVPTLIPKDDPCNDKNPGGIVEIDPIHGKWVKSAFWKAVRNGANIWHDNRTMGAEIGLDRKGKWQGETQLLDSSGNASSYAYSALMADESGVVISGGKDQPPNGCVFVPGPPTNDVGEGEASQVYCPGRAGRQSWRQLR